MPLKPRLLFLLFSILIFQTSGAQTSCTSNTFTRSFVYPGGGSAHFIQPLAGDKFLIGGNINNRLSLIMMTGSGDTLWTKQSAEISNSFISACVVDTDGNPWIAYHHDRFIKIDAAGNVLQALRSTNVQESFAFKQMLMGPNGDMFVCYSNTNWVDSYVFIRYASGFSSVKWARSFESVYPADISISDMVIDNDKLVAVGHLNQSNSWEPRGSIFQIDLATGVLIKKTSFMVNGEYVTPVDIQRHSNGYVVQARLYMGSTAYTKDVHTILRVDTALNISSAYHLTNVNNNRTLAIHVQEDGSFYGSETSSWENFFFVDKNDSVRWRNSINGVMITRYVTDIVKATGNVYSLNHSNYFLVAQGINQGYFSVSKTDLFGKSPGCYTQPRFFGQQPIGPTYVTLPVVVVDTAAVILPYTAVFNPLAIVVKNECTSTITCNSLKIIGDTTVCASSQFVLKGRRNNGCTVPLIWEVIQGPNVGFSSTNDSTAVFNYTQSGDYIIVASLPGSCSVLRDTITIHVSLPGGSGLGPDTILCVGQSLVIAPGGNFKNYTWQDGSSQSSFPVHQSGQYFYSAEDYCGNFHRDTISIDYYQKQHFTLPPTAEKCARDTLQYVIDPSFSAIAWQPVNAMYQQGGLVKVITTVNTAIYLSAIDSNSCAVKDTINITIKPAPLIDLGPASKSICSGDSLVLTAPPGFIQYNWNNGASTPGITIKQPGKYIVTVTAANGCHAKDSMVVNVSALPVIDLGKDTSICFNSSITFSAQQFTGYVYQWQDGSTLPTFEASVPGLYAVLVTNAEGCKHADTVRILSLKPLPAGFLPADTVICPNYSFSLYPTKSFLQYQWSTGNTGPMITVDKTGTFELTVTDQQGCHGVDSIIVSAQLICPVAIYFPNAFTPNNDGNNDAFKPRSWGILDKFHLAVFNRFGEQIFETKDVFTGWTGLVNGIPQQAGTYIWQAVFQFRNEPARTEKGTVLLIR